MTVTDTSGDAARRRGLSAADRAHYFDEGYLVLRNFATADEVGAQ